ASWEILDVSGSDVSDFGLIKAAEVCRFIKALDISRCTKITAIGISELVKHCHSLETLRCGGCPRSDNNNINLKAVPSESSNIGTKQCDNNNNNNSFKRKMEEKVSKVVTKCQSSSSTLDHNNSLGAFNGISYP
ncbi:hypothetical protein KIW84_032811, partial [Lathyrus oleraceus]